MSSPYYSQFGQGHEWGRYFVLTPGTGVTPLLFFYDEENGEIRIWQYDTYRTYDTAIPGGDRDDLVRLLEYNINTDTLISYTWNDPDYAFEKYTILGPEDNNSSVFDGRNDYVEAGAGNDNIDTIDGNNFIYGGPGIDNLSASEGDDVIFGNGDRDTIHGGSYIDFLFGGDGDDEVHGGPGSDVISGGAGNDNLDGGDGHDIIIDYLGDNVVTGGAGDDFVILGGGNDIVYLNDGNDIAHLGNGDDYANDGTNGDDIIFGEAGNDRIYTQKGADVVYGGDDDDYISGSTYGDDGDDIFYGQGGSDELKGRAGNDKLFADDPFSLGLPGNDKLRGGDGDDLLVGGNGRDLLYGENGDDWLVASPEGQSIMTGGAGHDVFSFLDLPEGKAHNIEDFTVGEDVLNISDLLSGYDSESSDIDDFVQFIFRDVTRTDVKISTEGTGDDWVPVTILYGDYTGVTPEGLLSSGGLVADDKLFDTDWT